jgi:hypothetical protein
MLDASASSSRPPSPDMEVERTSKHFPPSTASKEKKSANGAAPHQQQQQQTESTTDADGDEEMLDVDADADGGDEEDDLKTKKIQAEFEKAAKKQEEKHRTPAPPPAQQQQPLQQEDETLDLVSEDGDADEDVAFTGGRGMEGGGHSPRPKVKMVVTTAAAATNDGHVSDSQEPETQDSARNRMEEKVDEMTLDDDEEEDQLDADEEEVVVKSPVKDKGKGKAEEKVVRMDVDPQDDRASNSTDSSADEVAQNLGVSSSQPQPQPPPSAQAPPPRPPLQLTTSSASNGSGQRQAVPIFKPTEPPKGAFVSPAPSVELQSPQATPPAAQIDPSDLEKCVFFLLSSFSFPILTTELDRCYILVFDSLDGDHKPVHTKLRDYLKFEAISKLGKKAEEFRWDEVVACKAEVRRSLLFLLSPSRR